MNWSLTNEMIIVNQYLEDKRCLRKNVKVIKGLKFKNKIVEVCEYV